MTPDREANNRHAFDCYCKKHLKYTARNLYKKRKSLESNEVAFSQMRGRELGELTAEDKYFTDDYVFSVFGEAVNVSDADLGIALTLLPSDRRDIVLMSYFFDMTDSEIADKLKVAPRMRRVG